MPVRNFARLGAFLEARRTGVAAYVGDWDWDTDTSTSTSTGETAR
ncbi:hypothetical protein [Streptomyces sp. NPDC056169]